MKQIGIIKSIVPLSERQYPDQYGQNQIFAVLGIRIRFSQSSVSWLPWGHRWLTSSLFRTPPEKLHRFSLRVRPSPYSST